MDGGSQANKKLHEQSRTNKDDHSGFSGITSISHTSRSNVNINFSTRRNTDKRAQSEKDNNESEDDEEEEGKISLGSVSSDSLSISHNKDDDNDDDEDDNGSEGSRKKKEQQEEDDKSESMSDSLEKSKESIEEEIIEEIIDDIVESSENVLKLKQQRLFGLDDVPKEEEILKDLDSSGSSTKENIEPPKSLPTKNNEKELSPLHEDMILINNSKVSLNILKQQLTNSQENSTTNDISDLAKDHSHSVDSSSVPIQIRSLEHSLAQPDLSARGFNSLGTAVEFKLPKIDNEPADKSGSDKSDYSIEEDKSIEEMVVENSVEMSSKSEEGGQIAHEVSVDVHAEDKSHSSTEEFKEKVKSSTTLQQTVQMQTTDLDDSDPDEAVAVKKMQRADTFTKDVLDDISEESESDHQMKIERGQQLRKMLEANITKRGEEINETLPILDYTMTENVQTDLVKTMENRIKDLQNIVSSKDVCIAALNSRLEGISRRGSWKGEGRDASLPNFNIGSGKESSSFTSTIYKDVDENAVCDILDIQAELNERDQLIEQLTEQLQNSLTDREELQRQGEKLTNEVENLKRQLADTLELLKKPPQWRETSSQRLSQVSIDLVSDFDDEEDNNPPLELDIYNQSCSEISQELDNFKKLLKPDELKLFNMVQRKFDDYLREEMTKIHSSHESEIKILMDQLESEKIKNGNSLNRLKAELETKHTQEMEELRTYFEKKCSEMEKQYSEEVFSSRRHSLDTASDISDQDNLPDEGGAVATPKHKTALLTSPTHRKITPTSLEKRTPSKRARIVKSPEIDSSIDQLKVFYSRKIDEMQQKHEDVVQKLKERLKRHDADSNAKTDDFALEDDETGKESNEKMENFDHEEFHAIVADFERRLQEQVQLAREDVITELEKKFQALVSDSAAEESDWPREFLLLREQFTAKSQLEITQLKIQHAEEMARLKSDYEWKLQQKLKRQNKFDSGRDLDKIIIERDTFRELCSTFRWVLSELATYCSMYGSDLNATLFDELQKYGVMDASSAVVSDEDNKQINESVMSTLSNSSKRFALADMSRLMSIIEEPSLVDFLSTGGPRDNLNEYDGIIEEITAKLKIETSRMTGLQKQIHDMEREREDKMSDKSDSCEEEDGLKSSKKREKSSAIHVTATKSLDDNAISTNSSRYSRIDVPPTNSLPIFTPEDIANISFEPKSELNVKLHELKNRLVKSEDERRSLEQELADTMSRHDSLVSELREAKQQIASLESSKEMISEGYGINPLSPQGKSTISSLSELQERAKALLSAPPSNVADYNTLLVPLVEEFSRESDRYFDEVKQDKDDHKLQIESVDKQLKSTLKFLDDQAAEREQERDEFTKEIEKLHTLLKERDKERTVHDRTEKEIAAMKKEIESMHSELQEHEDKKLKLEIDLKDSHNKIYDLRDVITELETQMDIKNQLEAAQQDRIKELEAYIDQQTTANDTLNDQLETLRSGVDENAFIERISYLEGQLKALRPDGEQSIVLETITDNLKQIEGILDRKTKFLESLHADVCSASCSSPSEDVSMKDSPIKKMDPATSLEGSLPVDEVQRIMDKLAKHSRAEEAAVKRIKDLEMQIVSSRVSISELQNERDILQERMSEQLVRISSLQSRLDEQRLRAEELHRQGTSDLNIKVHDLQVDCSNLKETLSARDNQIKNLNTALEESKNIIDRLEVELAIRPLTETAETIQKLENNLKTQRGENDLLKDKIKNDMINKMAIPDLIETMLSDKNEEIDHLREKLMTKEKELQTYIQLFDKQNPSHKEMIDDKVSARTLSDIVSLSEYDEPDVMRRHAAQEQRSNEFVIPGASLQHGFPMETSKNLTYQHRGQDGSSLFGSHTGGNAHFLDMSAYPKEGTSITPEFPPRQINFSLATDSDRRVRENLLGTPAIVEEITDDQQLSDIQEDDHEELEDLRKSATKLPELETEIEILSEELKVKKEETVALQTEKKELQNEVNQLKLQAVELQKIEIEFKYKVREVEDHQLRLRAVEQELESRNKEIALLQDKSDAKAAECETMQIEMERLRKVDCTKRLMFQVETLQQQIESMGKIISHKDELLCRFEKDASGYAKTERELLDRARDHSSLEQEVVQLRRELTDVKQRLTEKMFTLEKLKIDYDDSERQISLLKNAVQQKDSLLQNVNSDEILSKLQEEQNKNLELLNEVDKLRSNLNHSGSSDLLRQSENMDTRLYELKQLLDQEIRKSEALTQIRDDLQADFNELKRQFDLEKDNGLKLQMVLDSERKQSNSIQNQDANLLQVLRIRLNAALENEAALQDALEKEKARNEHLAGVQRTKSFDNYIMMRSPLESPKKFHRSSDFEAESIGRLENEIKLLTAQKEREKERVKDMQQILERERERFEKDISERNEYLENVKREISRANKDKEYLEADLEHAQEKLVLQQREIESLELRLNQLQEMDSRRAVRRGKEIVESSKTAIDLQGVKERLRDVEKERDSLTETIEKLRRDIDRGAQREAKYIEATQNMDGLVPEQLMEQFREMNRVLAQHAKENHQLVETMQIMSEERRELQKRIVELEEVNGNYQPRTDLEERANHLFGKYLRTESYRKALVHQKRYLLMVLAVYEENEARALQLMDGKPQRQRRKPSFRRYVYVVIAIERMKYVVRRWQCGRRVGTRAIFSTQYNATTPRRSQSASTNIWATLNGDHMNPTSPPCRDRSTIGSTSRIGICVESLRSHPLQELHQHFQRQPIISTATSSAHIAGDLPGGGGGGGGDVDRGDSSN